jgi:hypothetical protein
VVVIVTIVGVGWLLMWHPSRLCRTSVAEGE